MNRAFPSSCATRRTRSSSPGAPIPALRPGRVSPATFPLAGPLPSPASATARASAVRPVRHSRAVRLPPLVHLRRTASAFPARPARRSGRRASVGHPASRAWRFRACAGSQTARGPPAPRDNAAGDVAFRSQGRRRHPEPGDFAGSIAQPARTPITASPTPSQRRRMTRGHRGPLLLRCRAPSSPSPRRFIPAHPQFPHRPPTVPLPLPREIRRRCVSRLFAASMAFAVSSPARLLLVPHERG